MTTLHIQNTVRDYDSWKVNFDKFDRARRDRGVRSYRIRRDHDDVSRIAIDLEFDNATRAEEFREFLYGVLRTPQSRAELLSHEEPVVLDVLEDVVLS